MTLYRNRGVLSAATLLCAVFLSSANAGSLGVSSVPVKFVRADLATPAGARKLYWRIQLAARLACHGRDLRDISQNSSYYACYEQAVDNAVAEVNATELTALHRKRTQRTASAQRTGTG